MRLIKKNALCLRPSSPVLHAPRLKRPPFIWDHCNRWCVLCYRRYMIFVSPKFKIVTQLMYLLNPCGVIISSVQTTYSWITRGADSAANRQQSALSDEFKLLTSVVRVTIGGRFGLVSTNYTLITWWNPVYNANIWRSIEKQQMTSSLRSRKAATSNQRDLSCCPHCSHFDCVMWPLVRRIHYHVMNIHQFVKMRKYKKLRPYFKICSDKWKHSILTTHCVILVSIRCAFAEPIAKVDIPTTDRPSG